MNALSPKEELAFYKAQLKSNEAVIASMNKDNKHIREHIKFLEKSLGKAELDVVQEQQAATADGEQ